jgi:hypothetical protein
MDDAGTSNEFFVADGLTFGIRIDDGAVAVATGDSETARSLVTRRLDEAAPMFDHPNSAHDPEGEATSLTLMVAQRCNLRCTYCYGKDGEYGSPAPPGGACYCASNPVPRSSAGISD